MATCKRRWLRRSTKCGTLKRGLAKGTCFSVAWGGHTRIPAITNIPAATLSVKRTTQRAGGLGYRTSGSTTGGTIGPAGVSCRGWTLRRSNGWGAGSRSAWSSATLRSVQSTWSRLSPRYGNDGQLVGIKVTDVQQTFQNQQLAKGRPAVDIVGVAGSIPAAPTLPFPAKSIISQIVGSASIAAPPASGNTWVTGRVF